MDDKKLVNFPWEDSRLFRRASQFYSNFLATNGEEFVWPIVEVKQKVYFIPEIWESEKLAFLLLGLFSQEFKYEREHYGKEGAAFPHGYNEVQLFHCLQRSEVNTEELSDRILAEFPHSLMQRDKVRFCYCLGAKVFVFSDPQLEAALKEYLVRYCWGVISYGSFLGRDEMIAFRTPYAYYQDFVDVKTAVQVHVLGALVREVTRVFTSEERRGVFDFSRVFFPVQLSQWKGEYKLEEWERFNGDSLFIQGFGEGVTLRALADWLGENFVTRGLVIPSSPDEKEEAVFFLRSTKDFANALQTWFPWLIVAFDMENSRFFIEDAEKAKGEQRDV